MTTIGQQLGPYQIIGRLGAGGMGEVHLARDTRLEREVALKMLPRNLSRDPEQLGRFRREALTLASLNHPNIATIYGFEESGDGLMVLVLERVEGESLAERLRRGALPLEEALQVCAQIAEALEVAHQRGVVHRDMKPGNVMLGPRGLVKVLDFGLAKRGGGLMGLKAESQAPAHEAPSAEHGTQGDGARGDADAFPLTAQGTVMGTPGYMSPEQVLAGAQDERTDIFAFGCVLYECLTGLRAFAGRDEFEVMAAVLAGSPDLTRLPGRTPSRIRELIEQCLEKDPERRLREIRTAREAIEEALGVRRASALRLGEAVAGARHNLPAQVSSFVGREHEIEECVEHLAHTRLLTLTGVGGCGKTRLALRVAERLEPEHPDGVWFVDLAPVADPERIPSVLGAALGVREEPGRPLVQSVTEHLGPLRALVLLDNCEHLIAACAEFATHLQRACPQLRILATSREGLGVDGERIYAVPTLPLPARRERLDAATVGGYAAVRLFVERAVLHQPAFQLNDQNAAVVVDICRQLDGIPLAIELAAARARMLTVEQIHSRLDNRFRLLTGGSRSALPRHQTLRATIQWSVDQLAEEEQVLLRRLSVFAGGWTLDKVVAVCEHGGDEFEVLDRLTRLADKSLVQVERKNGGATRYRFLESIRQYAQEMLERSGEAPSIRDRHLETYLQLAEESERHLTGPKQGEWFQELEAEQDNLLASLAWCDHASDGATRGLRLTGAVWRSWSARGYYELGRRELEKALHRDVTRASPAARAKVRIRAAGFALYQGDYDAARPHIEESLAIYREIGDQKGIARALSGLGTVATYQADYAAARTFTEESLARYRSLGEKRGAGVALLNLGYLAWSERDYPSAERFYGEALALLREVGDQEYLALSLAGLAVVRVRLGRADAAGASFLASLRLVQELSAKREGAYALEGMAELADKLGEPERAARFCGAAETLRREIGSPPVAAEVSEREALLARIRGQLGGEPFDQALAAGRALEFEAAVADALKWLARGPGGPSSASQ